MVYTASLDGCPSKEVHTDSGERRDGRQPALAVAAGADAKPTLSRSEP
jgi:hypothetical protein